MLRLSFWHLFASTISTRSDREQWQAMLLGLSLRFLGQVLGGLHGLVHNPGGKMRDV
jgi:hypothetical protein